MSRASQVLSQHSGLLVTTVFQFFFNSYSGTVVSNTSIAASKSPFIYVNLDDNSTGILTTSKKERIMPREEDSDVKRCSSSSSL